MRVLTSVTLALVSCVCFTANCLRRETHLASTSEGTLGRKGLRAHGENKDAPTDKNERADEKGNSKSAPSKHPEPAHEDESELHPMLELGIYFGVVAFIFLYLWIRGEVDAARYFFSSWKYSLMIFVPISFALNMAKVDNPAACLVVNVFAIIPCAFLIEQATDVLAEHAGPAIGALLNCTFGNLVEIIIGLGALWKNEIDVVQGNILGSIYSNLLIVLGGSFVATACHSKESSFDAKSMKYNFALLGVGIVGILTPSYVLIYDPCLDDAARLSLSVKCSVVLAVLYVLFVVFKMFTDKDLFVDSNNIIDMNNTNAIDDSNDNNTNWEHCEPSLSMVSCGVFLAAATYLCSKHCDYLVDALEPIEKQYHVNRAFSAVILLPVVGNISTIYVGITSAAKNKVNVSVEVALSSCTQCLLLVIPLLVFIGLAGGVKMDLIFSPFDTHMLVAIVMFAGFNLQDGAATWLKGCLMLGCYVIMGFAFWDLNGVTYLQTSQSRKTIPAWCNEFSHR